jgi:hypothetical protein
LQLENYVGVKNTMAKVAYLWNDRNDWRSRAAYDVAEFPRV